MAPPPSCHPGRVAHSALVVPVPALEPFVRARHEHYDADYVSGDPTFAHAHITLLAPFVSELTADVAARVATVVTGTAAFPFTLRRVATFPNGIVHLVPEPSHPFGALTAGLVAAFPAYPPYGGQFPDVTPHLTSTPSGPVSRRSRSARRSPGWSPPMPLRARCASRGTSRVPAGPWPPGRSAHGPSGCPSARASACGELHPGRPLSRARQARSRTRTGICRDVLAW